MNVVALGVRLEEIYGSRAAKARRLPYQYSVVEDCCTLVE